MLRPRWVVICVQTKQQLQIETALEEYYAGITETQVDNTADAAIDGQYESVVRTGDVSDRMEDIADSIGIPYDAIMGLDMSTKRMYYKTTTVGKPRDRCASCLPS